MNQKDNYVPFQNKKEIFNAIILLPVTVLITPFGLLQGNKIRRSTK